MKQPMTTTSTRSYSSRLVGRLALGILSAALTAFDAQADEELSTGEIRKIDLEARKITIKHGPLESLEMPAMTMAYRVRDLGLVEGLQAGDAVRFQAERLGSVFIVTRIELAR